MKKLIIPLIIVILVFLVLTIMAYFYGEKAYEEERLRFLERRELVLPEEEVAYCKIGG